MAGDAPPPGFVDLVAVRTSRVAMRVNVIGAVIDLFPPARTATGDYMVTFKLQDPKLRNAVNGDHGLRVRAFSKRLEDLPQVKGAGDVVFIRSAKLSEYQGEIMLLLTPSSSFLVFSGANIPDPAFKLDYVSGNSKLPCQGTEGLRGSLSPIEQDYIITLKRVLNIPSHSNALTNQAQPSEPNVHPHPDATPRPAAAFATPAKRPDATQNMALTAGHDNKFKLIKNLRHRVFSNMCVEVVKKFENRLAQCELYVTDYTENHQMFYYAAPEENQDLARDGDQYGYQGPPRREWPGPYGFYVFKVTLVDPHAGFARNHVEQGDLVYLENVKVKLMPNSTRLEGDMWPDPRNPSKVQIRKVSNAFRGAADVLLRKDAYWAQRRVIKEREEQAVAESEARLTKTQKKKLKAAKKQEEARRKAEQEGEVAEKKLQANPHVRCSYIDHPPTTISNVLDTANARHTSITIDGTPCVLPFNSAKHHVVARVVDFFPPKLEDFAFQLSGADIDDDKSAYSEDMTWDPSTPHWEWNFALQVQEAAKAPKSSGATQSPPAKIWLNVGHMEAQHLLGNGVDDPSDLRENPALLNQLREKLSILWGDLEELKREEDSSQKTKKRKLDNEVDSSEVAAPSNRPFNCCVQEYGVLRDGGSADEVADWDRQYMMFGVVIS